MLNEALKAQVVALRAELVKYANGVVLGSGLSGEDLVHDVIVKVLKAERTFNEDDNIRAYLYMAIRNTFISINSREARKVSLASNTYGVDGEGSAQSNDEAISSLLAVHGADQMEISPRVKEALATLDPRIAQTVILVDFYGYTYGEASEVLGCKATTIPSRVSRGREQLKALLITRENALA